jgi:hypothetical protein
MAESSSAVFVSFVRCGISITNLLHQLRPTGSTRTDRNHAWIATADGKAKGLWRFSLRRVGYAGVGGGKLGVLRSPYLSCRLQGFTNEGVLRFL